jgi:hypothetical protein
MKVSVWKEALRRLSLVNVNWFHFSCKLNSTKEVKEFFKQQQQLQIFKYFRLMCVKFKYTLLSKRVCTVVRIFVSVLVRTQLRICFWEEIYALTNYLYWQSYKTFPAHVFGRISERKVKDGVWWRKAFKSYRSKVSTEKRKTPTLSSFPQA